MAAFADAVRNIYPYIPPLSSINRVADTTGRVLDTVGAAYDTGSRIYDRYRQYRESQQKASDNRSRFVVYDNRLLPYSRVESSPYQYQGQDIPSVIRARRRGRARRRFTRNKRRFFKSRRTYRRRMY